MHKSLTNTIGSLNIILILQPSQQGDKNTQNNELFNLHEQFQLSKYTRNKKEIEKNRGISTFRSDLTQKERIQQRRKQFQAEQTFHVSRNKP